MPNGQIISQSTEVPANIFGAANAQYLLLESIIAANPGIWMPWSKNGFSRGSFEVAKETSDAMVGTVKLQVSNAATIPANIQRITVAGSPADGDLLTVKIIPMGFATGGGVLQQIEAQYEVVGSETLAQVTTHLSEAILEALEIAAAQFNNDSISAVVAGEFTAVADSSAHTIDLKWIYPLLECRVIVVAVGDTTLAVAMYDDGSGFTVPSCSVTAVGNVIFNQPGSWIRGNCTVLSSGQISALVQAVIP